MIGPVRDGGTRAEGNEELAVREIRRQRKRDRIVKDKYLK